MWWSSRAGFPLRTAFLTVFFLAIVPLLTGQQLPKAVQHVTVRFINPKSGKPIRGMWADFSQFEAKPTRESDHLFSNRAAQTNRDGEVVFTLSDPLPKFLSVHSFDLWYSGTLVPTSKVLNSGIVFDYSDAKAPRGYWVNKQGQPVMKSGSLLGLGNKAKSGVTKLKVTTKPGEIIFVERKITRWQWFLQELP